MKLTEVVTKFTYFLGKPFGNQKNKAMTLIEIIIVVALLGSLMVYLVRNIVDEADKAKEDQARLGMGGLHQSLQTYRIHNNRYPTTDKGLEALFTNPTGSKKWRGPYVDNKNKIKDPWDIEFQYESDGRKLKMTSAGIDGEFGTDDDIHYPEEDSGE